ncbi:MAG: DUF560 domain-containing protein [Proteobacteria bacterium]|nr:MAG: DUF560 domain-containing protein [Pseudomonadota bacterium]
MRGAMAVGSFLGLLPLAPTAFSQEVDTAVTDAIITGNQVEAAQDDALRRQRLPQVSEREDGEGPYILIKEPIFSATLRAGLNYTDNPTTTADNPKGDFSKSILLDTGADTRIRGFDAGAHAYVGENDYDDLEDLGSTYAAGFVYVGKAVSERGDYLRLQIDRGSNYDRDFNHSSPYTSARASWSRSIQATAGLRGYTVRIIPSLSVTRFDYRNDALDYDAYSAALSLSQQLGPRVSGNLSLSWTARKYDDFFENSTGVAREDDNVAVSMNVDYAISDLLTLSLHASWNDNSSTLATSEYDAFNIGANLSFRKAF